MRKELSSNLDKKYEVEIEKNLLQNFEGVSPGDLHLWEDGYKDAQRDDFYWNKFQEYLADT